MLDKLAAVESRFLEIEGKLADPSLAERPEELRRLSKEHSGLQELVDEFRFYRRIDAEYRDNKELLDSGDADFSAMAKEEMRRLEPEIEAVKKRLQVLLLPQDPNDDRNIMIEIRAGAGGEEAALFAGELFRMYQRFSERQGWRFDILSMSEAEMGGVKEIIGSIEGTKVYSRLKYEGGVHRVQRVPKTETQGRVHTSTVTVAILPEADEVDVQINPADLRIDVFRSGGAGGQSVNTTDSAVRITHIPSGTVVACQDERSQLKNKAKAMKILRSRVLEVEQAKAKSVETEARRSMVGTGDRSERIRTYNFPQGRLTDHRIGFTIHSLPEVMEGRVDDLLNALQTHYQTEELKRAGYVSA